MPDEDLGLKIDNMLIKLHRISVDLGSLAYQAKEIKEELRETDNLRKQLKEKEELVQLANNRCNNLTKQLRRENEVA